MCYNFIYIVAVIHTHIGLDDDTHRQLNRIEAMLTAICEVKGISPDALPGYNRHRSPSQSSPSPSSTGSPLERQYLSDAMPPLHDAGMDPYFYNESNELNQILPNASEARAGGAGRGRSSTRTSSNNSRGSSLGRVQGWQADQPRCNSVMPFVLVPEDTFLVS